MKKEMLAITAEIEAVNTRLTTLVQAASSLEKIDGNEDMKAVLNALYQAQEEIEGALVVLGGMNGPDEFPEDFGDGHTEVVILARDLVVVTWPATPTRFELNGHSISYNTPIPKHVSVTHGNMNVGKWRND